MDQALMQAFKAVQTFVQGSTDLEATMHELADLATNALGADMAGLTVRDARSRPKTVVYTDRMVPEIDEVQYDNDRGPCLDAARTRTVFEVREMADDDRWPEFAAAALGHGMRSSLSMPVVVANDGLGALNFYDHRPGFFDSSKRELADLFAGQCAIVSTYWNASNEATNLARAMETRAVIEQAKGVIMGATGCTADDAFSLLTEQSQRENRKLREIAEEIVARQKR